MKNNPENSPSHFLKCLESYQPAVPAMVGNFVLRGELLNPPPYIQSLKNKEREEKIATSRIDSQSLNVVNNILKEEKIDRESKELHKTISQNERSKFEDEQTLWYRLKSQEQATLYNLDKKLKAQLKELTNKTKEFATYKETTEKQLKSQAQKTVDELLSVEKK